MRLKTAIDLLARSLWLATMGK